MHKELLQFKLLNVWTLVDLPNDKWAIGTKWVFRNKKDKRGIVIKNKVRLVAQGHTQVEGIDYDEVFAPVERIEAITLFLAYASFKDFIGYQMDVKSAFLYGKIKEEVYVYQPPSFEYPDFPDKVYKVEKALYGLHQASRAWYETLSTYLIDNGFYKGQIDKTLFIKRHKDDILLVQVYVDDIIFGSIRKEIRLQVQQKSAGIFISQDKYVADILKKFDFSTEKTTSTLMEPNKALVVVPGAKLPYWGVEAQTRFEVASKPSNDPPLSKGDKDMVFSGNVTPLFKTMMVIAQEEVGEGLGRSIEDIDLDAEIGLIDESHGRIVFSHHGDEHLNTIPEKESDKFIKSSVENLVLNPSEFEDEREYDVPVCDDFTTFSNLLFDADDDFSSSNDESFFDEDIPKEIYLNSLFDEEIIFIKIDPHHFNAESDLIESLLNQDSLIISSYKIDSLLDEFFEIRLIEKLLYDNSSLRPPKEIDSENFDAAIEYFSLSPILVEDSDSLMEEIDLSLTLDDSMPPGIENDNYDSEGDIPIFEGLLRNDSLSLLENESFRFDIPSSLRPPTKPPDDEIEPNLEILTIKVVGDISDHCVFMPRLLPTQPTHALNPEKPHHLLSHWGLKAFQLSSESPMMIFGGNIPILDVLFLHFYPP
nr:putative ribonuclease H-like domain-containing protein [Tanacetum cinerariifolium]